MANFERKELKRTHTIADKLKNLRSKKEIDPEFLAKKLNIPLKYILFLESGEHGSLPGDIYVRAWLKKIANFYEINSADLLLDYQLEKKIVHKISSHTDSNKKRKIKNINFLTPRLIRWSLIWLVIGSLFVYMAYEIVNIVAPPDLQITSPNNNLKTKETSVEIIGRTQAEAQLNINDELIVLDQVGGFKKTVNLTVGLNTLKISAKNKHSRTNKIELLILRESLE